MITITDWKDEDNGTFTCRIIFGAPEGRAFSWTVASPDADFDSILADIIPAHSAYQDWLDEGMPE